MFTVEFAKNYIKKMLPTSRVKTINEGNIAINFLLNHTNIW